MEVLLKEVLLKEAATAARLPAATAARLPAATEVLLPAATAAE